MKLPAPPVFTVTEFPSAPPAMLDLLNRGFREIYAALATSPDVSEATGKMFTTSNTGTAYLDLKVDPPPEHLWVTDLEQVDGVQIVAPFAQTWVRRAGSVRILFSGLLASTKHRCSVLYR